MNGDTRQRIVSILAFAGIACIAASLLLFGLSLFLSLFVFAGMGQAFSILLLPLGLVLLVIALFLGWGEAFGDPSKKPVRRADGVYVVAKVIADRKANPVIDPEFHDPSELRYLVQLEVPGRGKVEMETAIPVFEGIGEGMTGQIVYQGRWLNQFTFTPREGAQEVGEDPFRAGRL